MSGEIRTGCNGKDINMDKHICEWLLEDKNPDVKLRTLKEYLKYDDIHPEVMSARENLIKSKEYTGTIKKLHSDKKWDKFDALMALAEWGLTRKDVGEEIDEEVFRLIKETNFKMACAESFLLRDLVKLGYYNEPVVREEISSMVGLIKEDGGFGCISNNKKINDPKKPHKSCARLTVEYLLLAAELKLQGIEMDFYSSITDYFLKRNIFFRTDDMKTPMVEVMTETFYPPDPIKIGVHNIVYALRMLGVSLDTEAMRCGIEVLNKYRLEDGTYKISGFKSVPAFKPGAKNKKNKWITLYAYMAQD
ncbi:MAG: hypothetical protein K2L18_07285 [Acetatifactor sp.]|nr:hypothetical protein [Acetatifactor sp.]